MNHIRFPDFARFDRVAWQTVRLADDTLAQQPIPLPYTRRKDFADYLAENRLHLVRYGEDEYLSVTNLVNLALEDGQTALEFRNLHRRNDRQWRDWNITMTRQSNRIVVMLTAALWQIDDPAIVAQAYRGAMPSIKTAEQLHRERQEAQRRREQDFARQRAADREATRKMLWRHDVDDVLREISGGRLYFDPSAEQQHVGG